MTQLVRAHAFWITPQYDNLASAVKQIQPFLSRPRSLYFSRYGHDYLAYECSWTAADSVLTGTVVLKRTTNHPSEVSKYNIVTPLPISEEAAIGENTSFAINPIEGIALVQYNHNGPRHSVLAPLIAECGCISPVSIHPIYKEEMLSQFEKMKHFKMIEYTLNRPQGTPSLQSNSSVARAIEMLGETGGLRISVVITVGRERKQQLNAAEIRRTVKKLTGVAMSAEEAVVSKVLVRGTDGEDTPLHELDLLSAREAFEFEVDAGNQIDRNSCKSKLAALLKSLVSKLKKRQGVR